MSFKVVIPARMASSRLPAKPLAEIAGVPMIVRVCRQAAATSAGEVVVATDDRRIAGVVREAGFDAVITRQDHPSGTDRIAEVAEQRGWPATAVVVNVQGDEPLIPPAVIEQVAALLAATPQAAAATLSEPIDDPDTLFATSAVKVVAAGSGRALYFSRAPLPWWRDGFGSGEHPRPEALGEPPAGVGWRRHIGIYAYRVSTLRRFVALGTAAIERAESLEQLRLLAADLPIWVADACQAVPAGVDTPEDLARVRRQCQVTAMD